MTYTFRKDTDGTESALWIVSPTGEYVTHIRYWDEEEKAERSAQFICDTLNAFKPA